MPKDEKLRCLALLGVEKNATPTDIRLAFFKRSLHTHPETTKNSAEDSMATFEDVAQAYSFLSDGSVSDEFNAEEVFLNFFQEILKEESVPSLRAMLQEHDASKCADDEYRCEEDDNDIDIEREFSCLIEILKSLKKKGKDLPEEMSPEKVVRCKEHMVRQREELKKDAKKQPVKKGKQQQVPVSKPKPKSKKQLLAEQRRREKEMEKIALELEKKKKEDEEKEKVRKQLDVEKQKRLEEERKKTEAEARRQREREQKERERLQKLEQERERKQKEEEERRKKEEMKRKKAEQERIEKEKAEKAAKIKAAQQAAKDKEEQKNQGNKNQNLKRNQPQRNEQLYPREIPPRFQRRMKQQQQQQSIFPQQTTTTTTTSQVAPVQQPSSQPAAQPTPAPQQPATQSSQSSKTVTKPTTVGKKKDPNRWTKGEYTGIIEDVPDDLGWSKAPPAAAAVTSQSWVDTTGSADWGTEISEASWDNDVPTEERVIVDKTDQDSWPTVGGKRQLRGDPAAEAAGNSRNNDVISGNKDDVASFGDSLDAVIDGMEAAAEEVVGTWDSGEKWTQNGAECSNSGSGTNTPNSNTTSTGASTGSNASDNVTSQDLRDSKANTQTWSKTPGKGVKLKSTGNKQNETAAISGADRLSNSWDESTMTTTASGWKESETVDNGWKTVGKQSAANKGAGGTRNEPSPGPSEELQTTTGWGESAPAKRNSGGQWGSSWSASQGLSLTGTEIWDQAASNEDMKKGSTAGDKGCDWLENSSTTADAKKGTGGDNGWDEMGHSGFARDDDGDGWDGWTTNTSKRNKVPPKPTNQAANDENAWLRRSLKQLIDMGFKEGDGEKALKNNNMSLEGAISQLLGGQGTPPGHQSPVVHAGNLGQPEANSDVTAGNASSTLQSSTEPSEEPDISKLNRKQRRKLMQIQQTPDPGQQYPPESRPPETEPLANIPGSNEATSIITPPAKLERPVDDPKESLYSSERPVINPPIAQEALRTDFTSNAANNLVPGPPIGGAVVPVPSTQVQSVRAPFPAAVVQQQLLQRQVQMQQLRMAQASNLMHNPLGSHVVLLQQLSQLQLIQQQLANQQQMLQKQPQPNALRAQQLALQQQQIGLMIQQFQQQLVQQQQLQQQQQISSSRLQAQPGQQQQQLLPTQIQQLLLQQRKQQQLQQQQQQQHQIKLPSQTRPGDSEPGSSSERSNDDLRKMQNISPKESIAHVVNSAPASPSTGKSRLGQWTQVPTPTERNSLSPKPGNLRSSPQPDHSEKSLLATRSANSPTTSLQSVPTNVAIHRVSDPVSSKWGIDAAPKLSAEPPEFKPGVPWRPHQPKIGSEPVGALPSGNPSSKTENSEWSHPVSSTSGSYPSTSGTYPSSNVIEAVSPAVITSQSIPQAAWQTRPSGLPPPTRSAQAPLHVRPPPGLGSENSFLHLPDMRTQGGGGPPQLDTTWSTGRSDQQQQQRPLLGQFQPARPAFSQTWQQQQQQGIGGRGGQNEAVWLNSGGQPLDTMSGAVPQRGANLELGQSKGGVDVGVGENNGGGTMAGKPDLSGVSGGQSTMSTWLVVRNISPRIDSTALRSLCQQHGPLLTFQLNLRYGNSLIRYGSKEEAAKAHASLNGLPLAGSRLSADFATDSDIGSFFEQTTDWSTPGSVQPITTTWVQPAGHMTEPTSNTQWPGAAAKPLLPPTNFSSELWSFAGAQPSSSGGLGTNSVWSAPTAGTSGNPRQDAEQPTTVTENGITSPSMVTYLPPGLLNSGESM